MNFSADIDNDGVFFELEQGTDNYSGTLTMEALQAHFDFDSVDVHDAVLYCSNYEHLVEQETCNALQRHPPLGHKKVLILPHHFR